jgi:hypothetical protein
MIWELWTIIYEIMKTVASWLWEGAWRCVFRVFPLSASSLSQPRLMPLGSGQHVEALG